MCIVGFIRRNGMLLDCCFMERNIVDRNLYVAAIIEPVSSRYFDDVHIKEGKVFTGFANVGSESFTEKPTLLIGKVKNADRFRIFVGGHINQVKRFIWRQF